MSENASQTALAKVDPLPGQVAPIEWLKPLPAIGGYTSLDLATQRGRQLFVLSQQGEPENLDAYINQRMTITDIVMHPARREDTATGEIQFWTRCVMITPENKVISCGSLGIMKSLMLAVILHGAPPWPAGISGVLKQKPISDSKRWYEIQWELEPCPEEKPDSAASGNRSAKARSPGKN